MLVAVSIARQVSELGGHDWEDGTFISNRNGTRKYSPSVNDWRQISTDQVSKSVIIMCGDCQQVQQTEGNPQQHGVQNQPDF